MDDDTKILEQFRGCYDFVLCNKGAGLPCDYVAYTTDRRRDMFYVIVKNHKPSQEESQSMYDQILNAVRANKIELKPVVLFVQNENDLLFGIFVYWDDTKSYLNKSINWQTWDLSKEPWLNMQIHARRYQIDYLPLEYLRVIKKIHLNDRSIIDGQVVYLRKFTEQYKMRTPQEISDTERFNRFLNGTPENEYPSDVLDDLIYDRVRDHYPLATMETKLLLFHTDLLNLRRYKDFFIQKSTFSINEEEQCQQSPKKDIECYYYINFFKRQHPTISSIDFSEKVKIDDYLSLLPKINNYEPLSVMNI